MIRINKLAKESPPVILLLRAKFFLDEDVYFKHILLSLAPFLYLFVKNPSSVKKHTSVVKCNSSVQKHE
jgi:hypothetical protein